MLHPSTKMLIDKLSEMTRKQRVSWDEGENGHIIHDTEGYRVILSPAPHTVMLTDVLGKEIETCTPEDIAAEADQDGRPYSQFVAELYREAGRHARGTERAIDAVLRGLDLGTDDEPIVEAAPIVELSGSEIIEDLTDESDPIEFGELPQSDDDTPIAGEEIEGENEMTRAVEAMADQVNGHEPVTTEPAGEDTPRIEVPNFGAALLSEPEIAYDTTAVDTPALSDTEIEVETDTLPAPEPEVAIPPQYAETDESVEPEPAPTPVAPPPTNRVSPMGGSGFFGSSLGDLSRYRTQKLIDEASTESTPPVAEPTPVASEIEAPEPLAATPETTLSAEPQEPVEVGTEPQDRKFSLSGMTSGFGLGSPADIEPAVEPEPVVEKPSEPLMMIDGTVDLPDYPSTEASIDEPVSPVLPSFDKPLTPPDETENDTSDRDWVVRDEPIETAAPEATEPESEAEEPKAKKPNPFNPWN